MLDNELKKQIDEWVDEFEIEPEELESAYYDSNVYGLEPHLAVGGWVWDEDEYFEAQVEKAIEALKEDGAYVYFDVENEQTEEVIEYLKGKSK